MIVSMQPAHLLCFLAFPFFALGGSQAHAIGSPLYIVDPIEGWVVDKETGAPIEGAIVVANWQLVRQGLHGAHVSGQLDVQEVISDHAGRFRLEGFWRLNLPTRELGERDPQLIIFKPGYRYQRFANAIDAYGGMRRHSKADGMRFSLTRFQREDVDPKEFVHGGLAGALEPLTSSCDWLRIPRMLDAIAAEERRISEMMPRPFHGLPSVDSIQRRRGLCEARPGANK
jgi:hypothetical protein